MSYFKRPLFKTLATLLMAFALLLQVQNSFACEMMDIGDPTNSCCCELEQSSDCCELDSELVLVGADLDGENTDSARAYGKLSAPEAVSFLVLSLLWPSLSGERVTAQTIYPVAAIAQSYPRIYSLTQRFRI
jgi:hypothetical protein